MPADTVSVTGWGRTAPSSARLVRPRTFEEAALAVRGCGARGGIARGLGRAYGDAAQNAGGEVFDMTGLDRIHTIDADGGTVLCDAGVSLHRLMEVLLPLGWFVPVTPGTRYVTVGGAIGADIHGKNHHVSGSFSRHVLSFELLTADGQVRTVVPGTPLFEATAGGMGLTGVILTATVRLQPVRTTWMSVDTERASDLDDLMARLADTDHRYRYSVAWIDLLARGRATGRAVLTRGDHAPLEALPHAARREPLSFRTSRLPAAPSFVPEGLLSRTTVGLFNELWFRKAPRARTGELQRIPAFFHPLDGVPHWNRIYGRGGFVQYQFVVGHGREDTLRRIVRRISQRRCPSFLAVLKRFGDADPGWLSFPVPGWTLALDIPASLPGLGAFLDELDEEVAAAGGRVYLAKDSRLRPDLLAAMYPRLDDFRALRAELDPRGVFTSDLSRRLCL
ncbi:FAD-binding oxidoreductase [Streptomyces cellulosae]|jgi:decaprenylphospho-beta-D-ribofuranose 2-oxidase|uniref:Decaprenylphospho-beta-D-ribofuranose 2-oxidase n=1 Tax=Streptomyces thermodiastaticus TaxID=44061 RepID=A0ABU0KIS0_9ACTN|nr:FAD-binding oxidoreductase [Streptomyces sp. McG7]MCX4478899.1 FAD-binding oxidoreductase [Streptomyces cellulosae]MDQ0489194.1 decaprenylphospho-beta-D-ribofuranose 2-oxidase [Streptomyces thermodiastaticus]MXQ56188.1 FAD-binding protein [Streptomyces sp. XHT-2]MYQ34559.1 FAD-binding protein [Streptomyces sp. SID4956]MYW55494.1 FAD-binding protein [Streptomyces sp. SID8376]THC52080.1 FAD-binding oxidoreductase [Streptomyces sp. Akac8]UVT11398.1 FAD-binding oxidoreductase [Streptomyces th